MNKDFVRAVGIDPGVKGALALLSSTMDGDLVSCHWYMMPLTCRLSGNDWNDYKEKEKYQRKNKGTKVKPFPDVLRLMRVIDQFEPNVIILEKAFDGGSTRSAGASTIQHSYGGLLGTAHLSSADFVIEVMPRSWQKVMFGSGCDDTKQAGIDYCENLLGLNIPCTSNRANAKKHDGISDAVVLACFGLEHITRQKMKQSTIKSYWG